MNHGSILVTLLYMGGMIGIDTAHCQMVDATTMVFISNRTWTLGSITILMGSKYHYGRIRVQWYLGWDVRAAGNWSTFYQLPSTRTPRL